MTAKRPKPGRPGRPWAEWFLTSCFTLIKGIDYDTRTYTMAQQVRNAASKHRVQVEVKVAQDEQSLTVHVIGPMDEQDYGDDGCEPDEE